jgi:hypothetical protein
LQNGFIFGSQPRKVGQPFLSEEDGHAQLQFAKRSAATSDPFWDGLVSISEQGVANRSRVDSKTPN